MVKYLHQYIVTNCKNFMYCESFCHWWCDFLKSCLILGKVLNKIEYSFSLVYIIGAFLEESVYLLKSKILFICKIEVRFKAQVIIFHFCFYICFLLLRSSDTCFSHDFQLFSFSGNLLFKKAIYCIFIIFYFKTYSNLHCDSFSLTCELFRCVLLNFLTLGGFLVIFSKIWFLA